MLSSAGALWGPYASPCILIVLPTWHKLRVLWEEETFNWEKPSIRLACRQVCGPFFFFFNEWLMWEDPVHYGPHCPLAGCSGLYQKGSCAKPWGSSQSALSVRCLCTCSCLQDPDLVSALISLHDGLSGEVNPSSRVVFGHIVDHSTGKQNRTR